jgi:cell division FtsZ-interacting protein ZapD
MSAGSGYNITDINRTVATLARQATALKAQAADVRAWFDRISTGTDQEAADALVAHVEASGGTLSAADALLLIQAMREVTFFAATFAPTYTLDVRGPSALF